MKNEKDHWMKSCCKIVLNYINEDSHNHLSRANKALVINITFLLVWLVIVIFISSRHEIWRDEVRDYSLVESISSPLQLFEVTKNEGHPFLWYFLLYIGKSIFHTPSFLPVFNIALTYLAICLLVFLSPFKPWINFLIGASSLVLYEFAVISRPYGISFLIIIIIGLLYRVRKKHPILLAIMLLLLANTNVHSAISSGLITLLWIIDSIVDAKINHAHFDFGQLLISSVIIISGFALCALWIIPKEGTVFYAIRGNLAARNILIAIFDSLAHPKLIVSELFPKFVPSLVTVITFYLIMFGLFPNRKLFFLAVAGQVGFGIVFDLIYGGSMRHQGMFVIFIIFLYWVMVETKQEVSASQQGIASICKIGSMIGLSILILANIIMLKDSAYKDIYQQFSSSAALGQFLNGSSIYHDAIVVAEPDYLIESLHYYSPNQIYLLRENRFSPAISWLSSKKTQLTLGELITQTRALKAENNRPVLVALGFVDIDLSQPGAIDYSYNLNFSWTDMDYQEFLNSTCFVTSFISTYGDEKYLIFEVK